MQRSTLAIAEIPDSQSSPYRRACALAPLPPPRYRALSRPNLSTSLGPALCPPAVRMRPVPALRPPGGEGRQCACGLRRWQSVRLAGHGAHVSAEGRWDLPGLSSATRFPGPARAPEPLPGLRWLCPWSRTLTLTLMPMVDSSSLSLFFRQICFISVINTTCIYIRFISKSHL